MDPTNKLRIATRIHFALLRHFSEDVPVSDLLKGEAEAREALWVCEASGIDELVALAQQFESATADETLAMRTHRLNAPRHAPVAATPQDLPWAQDSSGFGVSRFAPPVSPTFLAPPAQTRPAWLKPSTWLRRSAA